MANERWRMAGDDERDDRFKFPSVSDDEYDDLPDYDDYDERPRMSFAKVWTILVGSIGVIAIVASVIALLLMFALKPFGVSLSYQESLIVAGCFVGFRFVDLAFVNSLTNRKK